MKKLNSIKLKLIFCWVVLVIYLALNVIVGSYPTDKEAYANVASHEFDKVKEVREKKILYRMQSILLPVWRINRYIYPALFLICIFYSFKFWTEYKMSNSKLKHAN